MKVDVMFTVGHDLMGEIIEVITDSEFSHASIFLLDGIVEAIGEGVVISDIHKYDKIGKEIITVEVPEIDLAISMAQSLLGKEYGLGDCITGGLFDLTGVEIGGLNKDTVNCSETVTLILRAGGVFILPELESGCITPQVLYKELKRLTSE